MRWLLLAMLAALATPQTSCANDSDCLGPYVDSPPDGPYCGANNNACATMCPTNAVCSAGYCTCGASASDIVDHDHQPSGTDNFRLQRSAQQFAGDDLSLTLGIAIGVPLGAAYLAVHNGVVGV